MTTACGPCVFLAQAEMATIPVSYHQLPSRRMIEQITKPAMISISRGALDLSADSHINATNASSLATINGNVLNSSLQEHPHWLQLNESTFHPVTPVRVDKLEQILEGHPNHKLVQRVVDGFRFGYSLRYNGLRVNRQPRNLPTAFTHSTELWQSMMKEVNLGRMLGPFKVQPIFPLICSPVSMGEKKNSTTMHRITHLSHPQGSSINSFITPEDAETHYQSFDVAVQLVASQGTGAFTAKEDFKLAFHNVPMQYQDLNLLGIKVQGQFFTDCALPFGTFVSCVIFEDISTLIHWIAERRAGHKCIHYLDDFFMVNMYASVCSQTVNVLKQVYKEIKPKMPIAPEKSEGSATVLEFLGLMLDTD